MVAEPPLLEFLDRLEDGGAVILGADLRPIYVSSRAAELSGLPQDSLLGRDLREVFAGMMDSDLHEAILRVHRTGVSESVVGYYGQWDKWLESQIVKVGRGPGILFRDVTARHRAQRELRESEKRLRDHLENLPIGVVVQGPDARIRMTNSKALELLGLTEDQILGKTSFDPDWTVVREDGTPFPGGEHPVPSAIRSRKPVTNVMMGVFRPSTRTRVWLLVSAVPRLFADGEVFEVICSFSDVTERREMQARLVLGDRLSALGTLAAGVAHEINNPLASVTANLAFMEAEVARLAHQEVGKAPATQEFVRALTEAREGAERVRVIVADLRSLCRADKDDQQELVNICRLLERALRVAGSEVRHRARLQVRFQPVPEVRANEPRLAQVFINLVINAAQAIPEGHPEDNEIVVATRPYGTTGAIVEVSDTGMGIRDEIQDRIFNPFFTTKPIGVGTGLGLSICHSIVSRMGGEMQVESRPGKGSLFRVILPGQETAVLAESTAEPVAAQPEPGPGRRGRVMVIDDEPMLVDLMQRLLRSEHDVLSFTEPRKALACLAQGEWFDAILCDLMMPELTGMDIHEALARLRPDQAGRIVFLSGGAFTERSRKFLGRVSNVRLDKPFDMSTLLAVVRGVVG